MADLKISKTGKHGSSKANMVGYDIITNKKYQETVPGHTMMFGFTPVKVEYEVADIHDGQFTAMTPDGQEKFFNVPEDPEVGEKLVKEFQENAAKGGDQFWIITVVYAPRMVGKKWPGEHCTQTHSHHTRTGLCTDTMSHPPSLPSAAHLSPFSLSLSCRMANMLVETFKAGKSNE